MTTRTAALLCIFLVLPLAKAGEPAPAPLKLSICTLLQEQARYPRAFVEIEGVMLTNGVNSIVIVDPRCRDRGGIEIGQPQSGADQENLEKLLDTVQLAYVSSTKTFHVMVSVTLVGTFLGSGPRPSIWPKEAKSLRLINGVS